MIPIIQRISLFPICEVIRIFSHRLEPTFLLNQALHFVIQLSPFLLLLRDEIGSFLNYEQSVFFDQTMRVFGEVG